MRELSLDDIRAESERRYGSLKVNDPDGKPVTFASPMRLEDEKLARVQMLSSEVQEIGQRDADNPSVDNVREITKKAREAMLLAASDEDAAVRVLDKFSRTDLMVTFEAWSQGTQLGEASA